MLKKSLVFMLLLVAVGTFAEESKKDGEIRKAVDGFAQAWNDHNPEKMASYWAEDGDLLNPWGKWASGRLEVKQFFEKEQNGKLKDSVQKFSDIKIRWISSDVALVDAKSEMTVGKKKHAMHHHVTLIMNKKGDKMQIWAARAFFIRGKHHKMNMKED